MNALVFDLEKFAVRDGPGIRTVVFLKGCPLRCLWCHNPESGRFENELYFHPVKCTSCGNCVRMCPNGCQTLTDGIRAFDRTRCTGCLKCASVCYSGALAPVARLRSAEDVFAEVLEDRAFFGSDGGLTLSGGEPMARFDFSLELCRTAKKAGIHTAMETCGFAPAEKFREIAPFTDLFLFDVKGLPEQYSRFTGVDGAPIFASLELLDSLGKDLFLRCPLIPGWNDSPENLEFLAELAEKHSSVKELDAEPYHPLGISKAADLGRKSDFPEKGFPSEERIESWIRFLSSRTRKPVVRM